MTHFVLVPGAMHGAWTWDRVRPLLESAGHSVTAEDLPGTVEPLSEGVVTLDLWAEAVTELVRQAEGPVVLVGHSRGGLVIGEVAERAPALITGLIYLTALLAPPGQTGLATAGASPVQKRVDPPEVSASALLDPAIATSLFYNRCSADDAAWAVARLCPEPLGPLNTPASVTEARWGRVPRAFIACSDDKVLTPERQQAMLATTPCDPVLTLDSDHSPFLSMPEELAALMMQVAAGFAGPR
jgi:pimeloyl-ACP methyl ester carboxylesterase